MIEINLSNISDFVSKIKEVKFAETSDYFYRLCKVDKVDLELAKEIKSDNEE